MIKNIEAAKELAAKYQVLAKEEKHFGPKSEGNIFTSYLMIMTGYSMTSTCSLCKSVDNVGGVFPKPNCMQCVWSLIPTDDKHKERAKQRVSEGLYECFCSYVHNRELDTPYRLEKLFDYSDYPGISEDALNDFNKWLIKRAEHLEEAALKAEAYNAENS